jgi:hypothetical protein
VRLGQHTFRPCAAGGSCGGLAEVCEVGGGGAASGGGGGGGAGNGGGGGATCGDDVAVFLA